jgi:hypothetical protein
MTAATFMGLTRWAWGEVRVSPQAVRWAGAVYGANLAFAALLTAGVGFWGPVGFALIAASAPVLALAGRPSPRLAWNVRA